MPAFSSSLSPRRSVSPYRHLQPPQSRRWRVRNHPAPALFRLPDRHLYLSLCFLQAPPLLPDLLPVHLPASPVPDAEASLTLHQAASYHRSFSYVQPLLRCPSPRTASPALRSSLPSDRPAAPLIRASLRQARPASSCPALLFSPRTLLLLLLRPRSPPLPVQGSLQPLPPQSLSPRIYLLPAHPHPPYTR